jgi:predicted SprT family Zn-dependent metalloprotease
MGTRQDVPRSLASCARAAGEAWHAAGYPLRLAALPRVEVNPRFRRSLARFDGRRNRIEIRADVARWPARRLRPLLIHELAHAAVFQRHGTAARAHGSQWQSLMTLAEVEPTARAVAGCRSRPLASRDPVPPPMHAERNTRRTQYAHRCPVCQMVRIAKRPVPRWRCRDCVGAGLEGRLVIDAVRVTP